MKIHIFNPETDYALASFSPYYTPPAEIKELRKRLIGSALRFADAGDAVLLLNNDYDGEIPQDIIVLRLHELSSFLESHPDAELLPWGWNPMLRKILSDAGVSDDALPSDEELTHIRSLSHRRTTISFNTLLNDHLRMMPGGSRHLSPIPLEFSSAAEAVRWEQLNHPAFFKAPWSSSGRGIMFTDELEAEKHILPWVTGTIRKQGSVMGETAFDKVIDFATEWRVDTDDDGLITVDYLGVSLFDTSRRGKYHGNILDTQANLLKLINNVAPDFDSSFIEAQKSALKKLLQDQPYRYIGPIGIDMMANNEGVIQGGVELNFRRTMGMPIPEVMIIGTGNVGTHLYKAFSEAGVRVNIVSSRRSTFPPAEIYILAVKDEVLPELAERLRVPDYSIVAHTSGSHSIATLKPLAKFNDKGDEVNLGVFYPLQTFTKGVPMNYTELPLLIEGSDKATEAILLDLARRVSQNVMAADSTTRAHYHLAAVLTCNFTNHLCTLAESYLQSHDLKFDMLLPLMQQTIAKLASTSPKEAQTGPAIRKDLNIINLHLEKLRCFPEIEEIYKMMTESILKM